MTHSKTFKKIYQFDLGSTDRFIIKQQKDLAVLFYELKIVFMGDLMI